MTLDDAFWFTSVFSSTKRRSAIETDQSTVPSHHNRDQTNHVLNRLHEPASEDEAKPMSVASRWDAMLLTHLHPQTVGKLSVNDKRATGP